MISEQTFNKIRDMQIELNKMVGAYIEPEDENAEEWVDRFKMACLGELFEARMCFYQKWWCKEVKDNPSLLHTIKDKEMLQMKLINALHFLMSIFITGDYDYKCIERWLGEHEMIGSEVTANQLLTYTIELLASYSNNSMSGTFCLLIWLMEKLGTTEEDIIKSFPLNGE